MQSLPFSIEILGVLGLYGIIFIGIEALQAKHPIDSELARKSTHIIGGFLAASLPLVLQRWQIVGLGLVMALAMGLSKRHNLFRSIHRKNRKGHGEVWFPLGIALLAIVEPSSDLRFISGVLVLGVSDALASIAGLRYGKRKYFTLGQHWKTYLGSTVFLLSSAAILVLVFTNLAGIPLHQGIVRYIFVALTLTAIEALSHKGYDNFLLPVSTCVLLRLVGLA